MWSPENKEGRGRGGRAQARMAAARGCAVRGGGDVPRCGGRGVLGARRRLSSSSARPPALAVPRRPSALILSLSLSPLFF